MCDSNKPLRYVDIGINLGDPVFRGEYHGRQVHENDLDDIIQRARDVGCTKFMVTGSDLVESRHAVQLAQSYPGFCYATVGVHPCQAKLFDEFPGGPEKMLEELKSLALEAKDAGHAVAFGEIGLDYDRLFLSAKEPQLKYFEAQLDLAVEIQLPLFLHSRAASEDFEKLLAPRLEKLPKKGLVHSFTGTMEEMKRIVALGLDVGVNGCSLKTEENLEVVKAIPLDRIQIETDGPWCEIRPSHASSKYLEGAPALPKAVKKEKWQKGLMVKGRNEPVAIAHVAHVIAKLKDMTVEEVCEATRRAGERSRLRETSFESEIIHTEKLPTNFGEVVKGVYRSSFPQPWHFQALKKLGLKMIVTFVEGEYTQDYQVFLKENGIEHRRILILANKDPMVRTPDDVVNRVLEIILNKANHPLLLHCNKGKHRTGCIVGCFRKVQGWDMPAIRKEYIHFSWPKSRPLDEGFIELFDETRLRPLAVTSGAISWPAGVILNPLREEIVEDENTPRSRRQSSGSVLHKSDAI
ncbi:3'-5'-exodeoxyribonuclease [Aspergillus thermomutatus]|uniref:diphosphoinositol-polyphosphate diphosphatase n=1 Tax=Aspergillus thermomutatus TaxID=41047 RepID=A0A397H1Z7_ASPTH|nr:uncharacterized protein CDV56_103556 [Aspergillus thermomutatus]RHZ57165.1 hypothetical protein CDV56_103556 [Aspergillus thermomutatus]